MTVAGLDGWSVQRVSSRPHVTGTALRATLPTVAVTVMHFGGSVGLASNSGEESVAQPVDADAQRETLTIEDLKASVGKGPLLGAGDIADTYYSDEEFLAALDAHRSRANSSSPS